MTTVNDLILNARALLDNYTDDGVVINDDEVGDFIQSGIRYCDMGQKELYKVGRMQKAIEITNVPFNNLLGGCANFSIQESVGEDIYLPSEDGIEAGAYYIEADRSHTIIVQGLVNGSWMDLYTHVGSKVSMTAYKGNTSTSFAGLGTIIRLKLVGGSYYRYMNVALYEYAFQDDEDVPNYTTWVQYDLPSDFKAMDMVINEYPTGNYDINGNYKFEQPNRFYYNYYYKGLIRINYKPIPTTVTSQDDVLEIDDIAAQALSFYIASWIAPYENQSLTNPLFQKFLELKLELAEPTLATQQPIVDVYGGDYNAYI